MPLISAFRAFLDALDGPRTAPNAPQPAPVQAPAPPAPPLAQVVEAMQVRLAGVEASVKGFEGLVKTETDRAVRAAESQTRAVKRYIDRTLEGAQLEDPDTDLQEHDAGAGSESRVLPMRARVEDAGRGELSLEDHYAAARRAAALSMGG